VSEDQAEVAASSDPASANFACERWLVPGAVFGLASVVPLLFTWFTGQVWEDFFITFRHARNFALGDGLVYQVGERVHGFTSPLNVSLLALFDRLFGAPESYLPALWAYRVVNISCFAGGAAVLAGLMLRRGATRRSVFFFAALYVLQVSGVAFTINGQEAGFLLLALAIALSASHDGIGACWTRAGIGWAGLLWSRPDGCILIAVLACVALVHRRAALRAELTGVGKATLTCTALYLPWFAFAWAYYGTPVPHTITAKMNMSAQLSEPVLVGQLILEKIVTASGRCFSPIYAHVGGWPSWVMLLALFTGLASATLWLWPVRDRLVRMASLAFLLHAAYLAFALVKAHLMPWYTPPTAVLGILAISLAVPDLAARLPTGRQRRLWSWLPLAALTVAFLVVFTSAAVQLRVQQDVIEHGTRTRIGLFLKDAVGEEETIYLEPLGYIGYFSGKRMLDYPGLASPRVVAAREEAGDDMFAVLPILEPDFLVLRLLSLQRMAREHPQVLERYLQVRVFDSTVAVAESGVRGQPFLLGDSVYIVLKRRPGSLK
jgi:hypothetical protein